MAFFEEVEGSRIVERHIRRLSNIEVVEARRVLKQYVRARKQIRERLSGVIQGTFTEAQLNVALAQIEAGIRELDQRLATELPDS